MKVKSESDVTQSCPTLSYPMDCSVPGSSIHGIFQARVPEQVAIASPVYAGQEATVRTGHRTTDCCQIGKGVDKTVYCHPAHLTYMQSTS